MSNEFTRRSFLQLGTAAAAIVAVNWGAGSFAWAGDGLDEGFRHYFERPKPELQPNATAPIHLLVLMLISQEVDNAVRARNQERSGSRFSRESVPLSGTGLVADGELASALFV